MRFDPGTKTDDSAAGDALASLVSLTPRRDPDAYPIKLLYSLVGVGVDLAAVMTGDDDRGKEVEQLERGVVEPPTFLDADVCGGELGRPDGVADSGLSTVRIRFACTTLTPALGPVGDMQPVVGELACGGVALPGVLTADAVGFVVDVELCERFKPLTSVPLGDDDDDDLEPLPKKSILRLSTRARSGGGDEACFLLGRSASRCAAAPGLCPGSDEEVDDGVKGAAAATWCGFNLGIRGGRGMCARVARQGRSRHRVLQVDAN